MKICARNALQVLMPWHDPVPLTRVWCLWEIYCAVKEGKPITTTFGPQQADQFFRTLGTEPETVLDAFSKIKAESARCFEDDIPDSAGHRAKSAIFGAIRCGQNGLKPQSFTTLLALTTVECDVSRLISEIVATGAMDAEHSRMGSKVSTGAWCTCSGRRCSRWRSVEG